MEQLLAGTRILDFSRYATGPYTSMLLADMGAEVIRVERPEGNEDRHLGPFAPDGRSLPYDLIMGRNKKDITLNLRSDKGKDLLKKLVKRSDVMIHNFTCGSKEAAILDYASLKESNPAIILIAISGFGQSGPFAQRACFDSIAQALSGAMSYTGFPGNPPTREGVAFVDLSTGLYAALGTMLALYHRQRTGMGQMVDVAMLDVAVSYISAVAAIAEYKVLGNMRQQQGNQSFYNFTDSFLAKDGWVMISVIGNSLWRRFIQVLGREELAQDPRFKDDLARYENHHLLRPIVDDWIAGKTVAEAIQLLDEARIPCGKVNSIADVVADPQVKAREMLVDMEYPNIGKVPLPGVVLKLSQTPGRIEKPAPLLGEHNTEIYCGLLGLSPEELSRLQEEGIV